MKRVGWMKVDIRRVSLTALLLAVAALAAVGAWAQTGRIEVNVTNTGFMPAEATTTAGLVHLSLVNGSGADTLKIRIAREGGEQLREIEVRGEGVSVGTELEAEAGVYTLTEVAHGWVFRLTVSAPPPKPPLNEPPVE